MLLLEHNTSNQTSLQNPEQNNNKQGQLNRFHEKSVASPIDHLRTSALFPTAFLRTHALCLTDFLRTCALCPMNCLRTSASATLLGLRICAPVALLRLCICAPVMLLRLRISALFFHCTCGPAGIDNFKTSRITQIVRSTDLNMRRGDLNPLVDPTCNSHVSP